MMVRCSCRDRLTPGDLQFVADSLSRSANDRVSLESLLGDDDVRDTLLDQHCVYDQITDAPSFLAVSPQLYFYVLTRKSLLKHGIDDRELTDYIASLLVAFTRQSGGGSGRQVLPYLSDLLIMMAEAGSRETFYLRAEIADTTLFVSGIFIERVKAVRERRGGPDLSFYEQMGKSQYYYASRDRRAHEESLSEIFEKLSHYFVEVRLALNTLSGECLHLSEEDHQAAALLSNPGDISSGNHVTG
ncbi:MAG: hypothetical protein AAF649_03270 [Verrucomicrobiota bacterium]